MFDEEEYIDILEIINLLLRNIVFIIIAAVIGGGCGFGYCKYAVTPMHQASVNMIVNTKQDNTLTVTNDNINSAKNLVDTYAIIIKSNIVLNKVVENLGLDMTYEQINNIVSVSDINNTQVMKITAKTPDRDIARRIVEQIVEIAPEAIVDAVEAGSCKVISEVQTTDSPIRPSTAKIVLVGAVGGAAVVCGLLVLKFLLSNYIEDDEDVDKYLNLPVLGVIPEVEE